jgi:hypothetical protein
MELHIEPLETRKSLIIMLVKENAKLLIVTYVLDGTFYMPNCQMLTPLLPRWGHLGDKP